METALLVEADHETAAVEAKSSPNSGDLLLAGRRRTVARPDNLHSRIAGRGDELVGCGAKNLGGGDGGGGKPIALPPPSTSVASPAPSREEQEADLVDALRRLVHSSSPAQLTQLSAASNNSRLLVEKLRVRRAIASNDNDRSPTSDSGGERRSARSAKCANRRANRQLARRTRRQREPLFRRANAKQRRRAGGDRLGRRAAQRATRYADARRAKRAPESGGDACDRTFA